MSETPASFDEQAPPYTFRAPRIVRAADGSALGAEDYFCHPDVSPDDDPGVTIERIDIDETPDHAAGRRREAAPNGSSHDGVPSQEPPDGSQGIGDAPDATDQLDHACVDGIRKERTTWEALRSMSPHDRKLLNAVTGCFRIDCPPGRSMVIHVLEKDRMRMQQVVGTFRYPVDVKSVRGIDETDPYANIGLRGIS